MGNRETGEGDMQIIQLSYTCIMIRKLVKRKKSILMFYPVEKC